MKFTQKTLLFILAASCMMQAQRITTPIRESMQTGQLARLKPGKFFIRRNAGFESMEEVAAEPGIAGAWLVNLQGNNIAKLTAESFKGKKFEDVRLLNLSHNNIRTIGPYAFKNLKNLRVLFLGHNQIAYIAPMAFSGLKSVRIVTLNGNPNDDMLKAQLQAQLPRALITTQGVTKEFVNYSLGVAGIAAATGIAAGGVAYATREKDLLGPVQKELNDISSAISEIQNNCITKKQREQLQTQLDKLEGIEETPSLNQAQKSLDEMRRTIFNLLKLKNCGEHEFDHESDEEEEDGSSWLQPPNVMANGGEESEKETGPLVQQLQAKLEAIRGALESMRSVTQDEENIQEGQADRLLKASMDRIINNIEEIEKLKNKGPDAEEAMTREEGRQTREEKLHQDALRALRSATALFNTHHSTLNFDFPTREFGKKEEIKK